MPEDPELARIKGAHELGLAFVRSPILLNGGAFAVLLAYMAAAHADALVIFQIEGLKRAVYALPFGIVSVMLALVISYAYTALNFQSHFRAWLDTKVIPTNLVLAIAPLSAFGFGVSTLIASAKLQ